ncbi:MAG: hypothetical protein RLP02_18720 [Coleofasciculus sp. C2-GNP5-27]
MSEIGNENDKDNTLLNQWRQKIEIANRNNIFCHCRHCGDEWVDSSLNSACNHCGSHDIERIPCWQFPDG